MLASTTASTATITRPGKTPPWKQGETSTHQSGPEVRLDAKIGGLVFDVVGSTATVDLITSPIKIRFENARGLGVVIDEIEIAGPDPKRAEAKLTVHGTKIEFESHPTQDDLSRLIELITPSKDSFDDDDILVDTLLRQREQGSVVRMNIDGVRGELLDTGILETFKRLGEEVAQVVAASPIVAGDERPGLLTLINVDSVFAYAELGPPCGRVESEMMGVGLAHVSAPTLFALAVGSTSIRRGDHEELLGEGMTRSVFSNADHDRPMIMVRMVGDEPEPVVKIKLWNVRLEYNVETLMALMEKPLGTTGEEIAQEMVQSIVSLPEKTMGSQQSTVGLGFDVVITDSVIALNPLGLKSKALMVLTNAQLQAALPNGEPISAGMEIRKATMMIIDDVGRLATPVARSSKEVLSEHIAGFASMGYVPVVTISTAKALLHVVNDAVDVEIRDDLLLIESCADSTQTLIGIFNGLAPPPTETEQIKYCTEVMPIDMLQSLTEDAFMPHATGGGPEELLTEGEDLPTNLSFVDSYYGHGKASPTTTTNLSSQQRDLLASMLSDDIRTRPSLSRESSGNISSGRSSDFREQVTVLDDEPLVFVDNHFTNKNIRNRNKRSLNAEAVELATHFPLRVKIREVNVIWNLHDGYDWPKTRDTISNAVAKVESRAAERRARVRTVSFDVDEEDQESVVDDFLFNSIYIGIPANRDPKELASGINRAFDDQISETSYAPSTLASDSTRPTSSRSRSTYGEHRRMGSRSGGQKRGLKLARSRKKKVQIELVSVNVDFLLFPSEVGEVVSSVEVRIKDLEIIDNVPTSTWRKFVTYCRDSGERELGSDMVKLECLVVKPVKELAATELVIKVSVLLVRYNRARLTVILYRSMSYLSVSTSTRTPWTSSLASLNSKIPPL